MTSAYPIRSLALPLITPHQLVDQPGFQPLSKYLDQVAALGYNEIRIIDSYGVLRRFDDSAPDPGLAVPQDPSELVAFARAAQARGISVMLQPFYHVHAQISGTSSTGGDRPSPADPQAWFENFRGLVLQQAALAEAMGAQRFLLFADELQTGVFAKSLSLCLQIPGLVAEVRSVFHGQIGVHSYSDGSFVATDESVLRAVDFIGIGLFPRWTDKNNPTVGELKDAYLTDAQGNHPLQLLQSVASFHGKPVMIIDLAPRSWDGAHRDEGLIDQTAVPLTVEQKVKWVGPLQEPTHRCDWSG